MEQLLFRDLKSIAAHSLLLHFSAGKWRTVRVLQKFTWSYPSDIVVTEFPEVVFAVSATAALGVGSVGAMDDDDAAADS